MCQLVYCHCRRVLARHFPDAERFGDIRECGSHNLKPVDILAGGFPCQDISIAGDGAGLDGERSGLWFEYSRIVRELRPRIVVVENVAALLGRGLGRILADLADCGYDAEWRCISAAEVGALHLRDRIWIVAYPNIGEERIPRYIAQAVPKFPSFSWGEGCGSVEDLRDRPDIPTPLFRGTRDGIPAWMDRVGALGNSIVPQIAEWIGSRIVAAEGRMSQ